MGVREFTGQLDAPRVREFTGQLDPVDDALSRRGAEPITAQESAVAAPSPRRGTMRAVAPYAADEGQTAAARRDFAATDPRRTDLGESSGQPVSDELGRLRDSFFSGVDSTRAAVSTVGSVAQMNALQQARGRLREMERSGQGESPEADGLRTTIAHYSQRLPQMLANTAEAQADAARGSEMTTTPAMQSMMQAKTFGEAWEAFKQAPYEIISGISAQSLATSLPALVAGAIAGPAAGAATMGLSSGLTEAGSSMADYARDHGIDPTNAKDLQAFYSNPDILASALDYAGKRAGIIGGLDAVSGGMAGRTIAPPLRNQLARQAINMPAQMATQAALGAAGEAGAQVATKGRIDEPGQVLAEAAGEAGGAPAEVIAFGREARRPTEVRKAINDRLDDFAATHGVAPEAVEKIKKRGQTRPLAELTDYYKRAIGVLAQAGIHKGPVDEQALGSLDEPQPAVPHETPAQPSEPTGLADPIDAGELLGTIDEAAHEGATSPLSDRPEPTQAQKEAGNYPMGHVRVGGLDISIENPEGSVRKGVDADGTPWESTLYAHYGYIKGSNAKDGDHLDVFIKPGTPETYSGPVWVIDQIDPKTGKYDEAKAILGASSEDEARRIYLANYDQTGPQRIGAITGMPMGAFRAWAKSAEARKPLGDLNGRPGNPAPLAAGADVRPTADLEGSARNLLGVGASEGGRDQAAAATPVASSTEAAPVRAGSGEPTGALSNAGAAAETSTGDKARGAGAAETVAPAPGVANQRTKPKSSEVSQQRQTTPGTDLLRAINRAGGIAPSLLHDLSVRAETNLIDRKTGKKRSAWANPRLDRQQLFRHGGRADLLELAETLEGEGYIEPGLVKRDYKAASEKVIELVRAAIEKKDVAREFDPNAIEAEMQRRREMAMGYPDYDAESAREAEAERQAIMAEANLTHPEVAAATTSDVATSATEPDTAQAMRAMGFDDEDIEHVNEQARLAASEEADRAAQESTAEDHGAAAREAHAPDEAGGGAPGDRPQEGLTLEAQTPESLAAKSERELQAQRADEAEQKRLADKAKADAQRDEFHLTGSDRAADENPNQGTLLEPGAPQYTGRDVPLDLFPETLPADTGSGGNRLGPGATQSRDVPAATGVPRANTLAIRPDPTHPGLYHVNSQLVEVGRREIPVASVKNWDDAITALQALNRYAVEHFDVLVTDKNGKPLAIIGSFKGARSQAPVYPARLLGEALRIKGAAQAWGVHNHPSATHTLSSADQFMNGNLARTFSPSTIEWMGTAAIGGNRYQVAEKTGGSVYDGDVQPGNKPTTVPIAERTIVPNNQSLPVLDSPDRVMRWTKQITQGGPGIVFVDNALRVSAWVPIANPEELGQLRQDGRFDRLVNSANEAGAAGAFIVNPGSAFSSRVLDNIASALNLADVKTIDVIDTATSESAAEQLRMPDAGGPVFSIADAAATNPSGQMRTHGLPRDLIEIHTARSTDALKAHPDYTAAKAGDAEAAARLVEALVTPENLAAAKKFGADVMWAYPHAEEATGRNAIPSMLANKYAAQTGGTVAEPIVQTNRAFHAGADAMQRMIARPVFDGPVQRGARYVLVDDVSTMGSTLAELANHITANGGQVVGVATLANSGRAPTIPAEPGQTKLLEKRYGDTIRELFQVEPAALTRDEARYLTGFRSADELRNRAAAAARARTERLRAKGLRQEDARLSVGGERSGEAAPHGTVTEADRAAVKQLQQSLRRQVAGLVLDANPARATPAGQEPTRDERRRIAAAELIERGFGKRVIYFDSDRPLANGVFSSEQPGVIFVWKNAERPFRAVVGHEMLHALRADRPGLYARLRAQLLPLIRPDIEERFTLLNAKYDQLGMKRLGRGALEEEFIADVLGDNFDDRKFWSRVGKADGIKGVLQEILHWLDDLIAKLTNRPNFVGNFGTAEYLTDVRKARDIVAAVVREYRAGETSEQSDTQTADGDGPKLSVDRHTTEQREALARAGIKGKQTFSDKIRSAWGAMTGVAADREEMAHAFVQGALDQFHGIRQAIKSEVGNLPVEQDPYIAARLANGGTSSVMRGLLLHGQAKWADNGQHLEKIDGTKGLLDILKPLGDDLSDWFGWMIGNRAARLFKEGRENNFTEAQIKALQSLGTPDKIAKFRQAANEYAAFKRSVLDVAEKAGLIDKAGRAAWDNADYVPFYRTIDEKAVFSPTGKKGLAGQSSGIRVLKGGTSALNDPMENLLMNFSRLIDASLKNNAIRKTVETLGKSDVVTKVGYDMRSVIAPQSQVKRMLKEAGTPDEVLNVIPPEAFDGMAKMWSIQPPADPDVVRVMVDGKPQFYRVNDPLLLKALTSFVPFDFPGMGVMRAAKRLLTGAVTATPEFMIRNFIRDSVSAQMIGRDGFNPAKSLAGVVKSFTETGAGEQMLFAGASFQGGHINAADPTGTATSIRRALRAKGMSAALADDFMSTIIDTPAKAWEAYRKVGEAIENANREAVFEAAMQKGKSATAAAFEGKDLLDFNLRGSSPLYQFAADVLPFFNARVQGMYRMGRSDPKRLLAYGALMATLSVSLALANAGEDWYEELEDWDKDNYWHFKVFGMHWRIPKPFELGVLFASLPERLMRNMKELDSTNKTISASWKMVADQLKVMGQGSGPMWWLPTPQLVTPAVNAATNYDPFRERPIENQGDEGKLPHARYSGSTSATARALLEKTAPVTDAIGLSPKKLEYLIGGYLGTMGLYGLAAADWAVRKAEGKVDPAGRLDDLPVVKSFYREDPARSTVFESDLYKMREEVEKIDRTIKSYRAAEEDEKADALETKNEAKLDAREGIARATRKMQGVNKDRDEVYADPNMTPAEKRKQLDELQREKNEIAKETTKEVQGAFQ